MVTTAILGSGVSYCSEIPGVETITNRILNGHDIGRHSDSIYYINNVQPYLQHYVKDNLALIEFLVNDIENFYQFLGKKHRINYEDIYYVLSQLHDSFYFEYENPAINSLIKKIISIDDFSPEKIQNLTKECLVYIRSVVWQMIFYQPFKSDQFSIIPELINRTNLSNIISLNHDIVLEDYLNNSGIKYDDGFQLIDYKYPQWVGHSADERLKLYKLHGSVNWFEVGVNNPINRNDLVQLPNTIYIQGVHWEENKFWGVLDGLPKLLIGTFNKMLGYFSIVFQEQYDAFKMRLKESNVLIISGYGFGDKGVNTQLSYWLNYNTAHKLIIIHPDKEALINNARGNFRLNLLNQQMKHHKVELVEKKFEELTIGDILAII